MSRKEARRPAANSQAVQEVFLVGDRKHVMEPFATFRARLLARRDDLRGVGALVDPVRLLDLVLAEFDEVSRLETESLLNLTEAARECGYSPDALGRMIRSGRIPNHGHPGAPRIRRSDLPRKPDHPRALSQVRPSSRASIARAILEPPAPPAERLA
jgi:hypothetical protein